MSKKVDKSHVRLADIGVIGLEVMGKNLALNIADHGFTVAVFNRSVDKMKAFLAEAASREPSAERLVGCETYREFVQSLQRPRKILIIVKSEAEDQYQLDAVDQVIEQLTPYLDRGDVVIDGGNSMWEATIRREKQLAATGFHFVGSGVSGGEEGARFGPSLMPGGTREAWRIIKPVWTAIAAKVEGGTGKPIAGASPGHAVRGGVACTGYIGPNGAGHFVKAVHNGIEYGDMQLICESYELMKSLLGMKPAEISQVFAKWNRGVLDSYLIEITADVLRQRNPDKPDAFLVDCVRDTALQKGTGKWTAKAALDLGTTTASIAEAVFARYMSADREQRARASTVFRGPALKRLGNAQAVLRGIRDALYCSKICSYAQGFALMAKSQKKYEWKLNLGQIAMIWRGGCIIRAGFLQKIKEAFDREPGLGNLLLAPHFSQAITKGGRGWRKIVGLAAECGIPCPQMMSALAYFDSLRSARLPATLLAIQRDFFGAHGFELLVAPEGERYHIKWPEVGRPMVRL
ncbi:MAG: NADP-dependent phosphogluconate dehydrogenase [Rhodopirellula sp.]|nr:NADP-dependent phosphogluconate dehydrogenase [Rhodopirellula sp.]